MVRLNIANRSQLSDRKPVVFQYEQDGIRREGFLLKISDEIVCYENVCKHLPVKLDSSSGVFLGRSGNKIICQSHGALYEPSTGICERGPCAGAILNKLKLVFEGQEIYIELSEITDQDTSD